MDRIHVVEKHSTPTFMFNITDVLNTGVSIADLGIMMILDNDEEEGIEAQTKYIYSPELPANMPPSFKQPEDWADELYAKRYDNVFAITPPFWRYGNMHPNIARYQVVLFRPTALGTAQKPVIKNFNLCIDKGEFHFTENLFPTSRTQ